MQTAFIGHSKPLRGSKIYILGMAYRSDIDDVRESPALKHFHPLKKRGAGITYSDPFVPHVHMDGVLVKAGNPDTLGGNGRMRGNFRPWEPRLLWCPGWDLNPHSAYAKKDFKSFASADFATRAH